MLDLGFDLDSESESESERWKRRVRARHASIQEPRAAGVLAADERAKRGDVTLAASTRSAATKTRDVTLRVSGGSRGARLRRHVTVTQAASEDA